jgi:hypothetical protein
MRLPLPDTTCWLWFAVAMLVTWRVTTFICFESGPLNLATHLRRIVARLGFSRLFTCFDCAAVWVAAGVVGGLFELEWRSLWIAIAVAGAASVLERLSGGDEGSSTTEEG